MGVPNSWGSRDSRDMGGRDQCGAVTRPWSPMKTSNWARSTKRTRGKDNGTSQIFVVSFIHAGTKHLSFHWELRDIHSRMMDCLQFSTRRLHEWDATWCWQDVIYIYCVVYTRYAQLYTHRHMTMFLVHTFCHYWMIRIACVFSQMIYFPVPDATVDPLAFVPRYHHAEDQEEPSTAHHHLEDVDLRFGEIHGSSFLFKRGWSPIGHVPIFPCSSLFSHVLNRRLWNAFDWAPQGYFAKIQDFICLRSSLDRIKPVRN